MPGRIVQLVLDREPAQRVAAVRAVGGELVVADQAFQHQQVAGRAEVGDQLLH